MAQTSGWIPKYIGDPLAFVATLFMIWRPSQGGRRDDGFILAGQNRKLKLSIALGIVFALLWMLLGYSVQMVAGNVESQAAYPRTVINVMGMLTFQWIFVGIFEEPLARGLAQTPLMSELRGNVRILRRNLHIGTIIAGFCSG